jgi:hypothetical protein
MSSQWLDVTTRPLPAAWSFGDVSCACIHSSLSLSLNRFPVTISMAKPSFAMIVLSQLDRRYFSDIDGRARWSLDFIIYKQGETEALAESLHARYFSRSVNLELQLDAGEYVVHVSYCRPHMWLKLTPRRQVRIDRAYVRDKVFVSGSCFLESFRSLRRTISNRTL